jgi:hypothetical protein
MALKGLLWILDDMAIGTLANCIKLERPRRWPNGRLALMEATARAAEGPDVGGRKRNRKSLLSAKSNGSPVFQLLSVPIEGPAGEMLFGHLRRSENPDANLAEHQAIAWAFNSGQKAVLVTQDQRAAMTALAELGRERVAHPVDLWLFLRLEECVSQQEFDALCWASVKKDSGLPGLPRRLVGKVVEQPS